ncbi:hypothetical protein AK812_SmicGene181 [Symbiodinium microadriaticum]|uniref:TraB domain-containing protein n=1 Tax=Symbiodinium microadriaticum TaxID=2951 RepID=A0A1Q9F790_SYMMI|nr:hypothetical protein AK812_SmicGene181 [Symbiodinium microadriaticum]
MGLASGVTLWAWDPSEHERQLAAAGGFAVLLLDSFHVDRHRRALLGAAGGLLLPAHAAFGDNRLCPSGALVHLQGTTGDVFVLGVTHLSNKSAEVVRSVVQRATPDLVMVELDASRVGLAKNSSRSGKTTAPPPAEAPSDFFATARPLLFHF